MRILYFIGIILSLASPDFLKRIDAAFLSPETTLSRVSAEFEPGTESVLILRRSSRQDAMMTEEYGDCIFVFKSLPERAYGFYKYEAAIPVEALKPLKLMAGDVDGNGTPELSVMVYKSTPLDPDEAKRPFFYNYAGGSLYPMWRGSRLSRPFEDYTLWEGGGAAKLLSAEYLPEGGMVLALYEWDNFGFVRIAESGALGSVSLSPQQTPGEILAYSGEGEPLRFYLDGAEIKEASE